MEETLQQEKQESEYKNPNEDQGGIRRRLRDRDLLRKRKAEAEEKETNQVESQRKRPRAEDRSGAKKKGRPRKTEPKPEVSAIQQEAAPPQEGPAVVVVPEPTEVTLDQTASSLSPLLTVESKPASVLAAPAPLPLFGSIQSAVFAPTLTPPAPVNLAPALFSPSVPAQVPAKDLDTAPVPVQDLAPAPDAAPVPTSDPAAAPSAAPPQVDPFYIGSQGSKALDQVLIEDLGPDEEQEIPVPQDKRADEDLSGTASINVPEQSKMFSVPTFPQPPPPQEYFPGNSF
ncbi:skin secretory protein xP2 isoform X2 [Dicentrarchus labrax]|uniref:skin secretory protein xP2 isoform X2 n=1 Tax=Dicentrarchus labrax TaxID=13489 RepID=UPI0021F5821C|nr:skin secretory protein xP2 isoform X2 [Dicentrarchus labrax]